MSIKREKLLSNFTRRNFPKIAECVVPHPVRKRLVVTNAYDESTQRVVKTSEYKAYDNAEDINKYSVADFALENVLAIGAPLSPSKLSPSKFATLDACEAYINNNPVE